nr:hypothetical protein [Tanacetum cinerariifolium]
MVWDCGEMMMRWWLWCVTWCGDDDGGSAAMAAAVEGGLVDGCRGIDGGDGIDRTGG